MKLLFVAVLIFAIPFAPFTALATDYQGSCSVAFQGTSTLHNFEGTGSCQPFMVDENAGVMTVPALSVAVSGMDTDNSKRDKKMRAMFDAETYPLITGRTGTVVLGELRKAVAEGKGGSAGFDIELKIRNIEKPVTAVLQNIVETDSKLTADLVFSLSLADYQLEPPSVFGFIKVGDIVKVTTSFVLDAR